MSLETLEKLRLLGDLEIDKKKLVQIVLVGQPELEEKLERAELRKLRQSVMVRCRLGPVGLDEVEPYIDARLRNIGHDGKDLFAHEAIEKIALYSGGIPRLINNICDNALLIAYAQSKFQVSGTMVDEVAADLLISRSTVTAEMSNPTLELATGPNEARASSQAEKDAPPLNEEPFQMGSNSSAKMNVPRIFSGYQKLLKAPPAVFVVALLVALSGLVYFQKSKIFDLYSKSFNAGSITRESIKDKSAGNALESRTSDPKLPPSGSNQGVSPKPDPKTTTKNADLPSQQPATRLAVEVGDQSADQGSRGVGKEPASIGENYLVAAASFVRNNPASNAAIIATLQPGTRISVTRYSGEYFRVRSLSDEPIHGYVHREDAFFERIR